MRVLTILLMFIMTLYSAESIVTNAREVKELAKTTQFLTTDGCWALMVITVAFDVACIFVLVKVV